MFNVLANQQKNHQPAHGCPVENTFDEKHEPEDPQSIHHPHLHTCTCETGQGRLFLASPNLWPYLIRQCMAKWEGRSSDSEFPFSGGVGAVERFKEGNPFEVVLQTQSGHTGAFKVTFSV